MGKIIIPPSPVANFYTGNSRARIEELVASIKYSQSGSGDPSPSNERPIIGYTGVGIYQSGEDTSDPTTFTVPFPAGAGTIYDGEADVIGKKLGTKMGEIILDGTQDIASTNWRATTDSVGWLYAYSLTNNKIYRSSTAVQNILSDKLLGTYYETVYEARNGNCVSTLIASSGTPTYGLCVRVADTSLTSSAAINAYLAENPIKVVYELEEPVEYDLSSSPNIRPLIGENNIWVNTGDISLVCDDGDKMIIKLNDEDVTSYFTQRGMKVTYTKVLGGNGGTMLTGERVEDVLAWKAVVTLTCMPLTPEQQSDFLTKIQAADPTLYYFDPLSNDYKTIHYMASISETVHKGNGGTGTEFWTGLVLKAEEK